MTTKFQRAAWGNNSEVFREGRDRFSKFDIFEIIIKHYQYFAVGIDMCIQSYLETNNLAYS